MKKNLRKIFAVVAAIALIGAGIFFVMTPKLRTIGIVVLTISAVLLLKVVVRIVRTIRWKLILNKLKGLFKNRRFWRIAGELVALVALTVVVSILVKSCDRKTVSSAPTTTPETSATTNAGDTTSVDTSNSIIVPGNNSTVIIASGNNNEIRVDVKNEDIDIDVTGDGNKIDNKLENDEVRNDIDGNDNKIENSNEEHETTVAQKDEPQEDHETTVVPEDEPKGDDIKEDDKKKLAIELKSANTKEISLTISGTKLYRIQQDDTFVITEEALENSDDGLVLTLTPVSDNKTGDAYIYLVDEFGKQIEGEDKLTVRINLDYEKMNFEFI